jgi:ABC-type nitrate/sulfonate/bicarbonate transport system substrate-binding protein
MDIHRLSSFDYRYRKIKKTTLFIVIGMLVLMSSIGCSNNPQSAEKINLIASSWPASAPFYVALDKGYFQQEGLDAAFQPATTGQQGLNAILSGTSDFCAAADTPIASAAISGKPISVIATIAKIDPAVLIIAKKESGISAAADLKSKKIGVTDGTGAEFFLNMYLVVNHISAGDVQIVNIAPDQIIDALLNGQVDAVSTWSPYYLELQNTLGSDAVVFTDPNLYTSTWNVAVTQEFARNNPQHIQKFLRAIIQANRFIQEHPADARSISAKYIGTDSSIYQSDWPNYRFTAALDQSLILNLEDQARWMLQSGSGSVSTTPNFLDYIDTDGLKAVQPDAVNITQK